MLGILKRTVSEKISDIIDSLSPSSNVGENPRSKLKRTRDGKIKDEQEVQFDMLVTPPEKRIKKINQDTGGSSSKQFSSFKDFIDIRKLWKNNFLWKNIVQGEIQHDRRFDDMHEDYIDNNRAEMQKEAAMSFKKTTEDAVLASPWQFKKTEETSVKVTNPEVNVAKRRALHSVKIRPHEDSRKFKADTKPKPYVLTELAADNGISSDDEETVFASNKEVIPRETSKHPDLPLQLTTRPRTSTVDKVIRLEERDRYRKLLAQFTCLDPAMGANGDDLTSQRSSRNPKFSVDLDDSCSRLKHADSIVAKLRTSLPGDEGWSSILSSTRVSSEAEVLRSAPGSILRDRQKSLQASSDFRDSSRSFSGKNTANITRFDDQSLKNDGVLGNSWTKKWRKILAEDEQERQKKIIKEERKLKDLGQKRKERELELLRKVEARKELDKKNKSKDALPALTDEMESVVSNALRHGSPSETLSEAFNMSITRHDIATLADSNWLNDEVVNFYFNLLHQRSGEPAKLKMHFFNSFFYPKLLRTGYSGVRRWTKKVDIFSVDIVVLPVHLGMHWCLAAIDMRKKQIAYYDSLKGNNMQCISALRNYIIEEHKDKKKTGININEWTQVLPKDIPEQLNGCDCGVFTCEYADCLTRNSSFNFTQNDMPYFRRRMIYEIVTKKLL